MTDKDTAALTHAAWSSPDCFYTVRYRRPLFQEIEFVVKESANRISYGGLEVGGFLFGRLAEGSDNPSVQIEAFRNIECEHAYGPSFRLSERDLSAMRDQLVRAGSDPELEGLRLVGWFISHARSSLHLSEQEVTLFNRLFPRPGQLTVLVKPDRFKSTQFAFLVRPPNGTLERDGTRFSMTLGLGAGLATKVNPIEKTQSDLSAVEEGPLPPKSEKPEEAATPVDAVPLVVPEKEPETEKPASDELVFETASAEAKAVESEPPTETKTEVGRGPSVAEPPAETKTELGRGPSVAEPPAETKTEVGPGPSAAEQPAETKTEVGPGPSVAERPAETKTEVRPGPSVAKPPDKGITRATRKFSEKRSIQESQAVSETRSETAESEDEESETIRKRREDILSAFRDVEAQLIERQASLEYPYGPRRSARIKPWLWLVAAIAVCLAGYWAYARLFLSTLAMDLHVDQTGSKVIVSWPAEETNVSLPVTVRLNNGRPVPLSAEDKVLGRTEVAVSGDDMKVEIVIHHWFHDTRGIVRYVKPLGAP
jgi:hypothetical protein